MNWKRIVTSPLPTTVWLLDGMLVAALRREADGSIQCAAEAMPEGACEVGPVGLQSIDGDRLVAVLESVQNRVAGARRAAVILPTGWLRSHLFQFDEIPRKQTELDQVVRWRLKKLLPVLPSELRVSAVPQRAVDGRRNLLCVVGVDRALANLEIGFSRVDVEPGLVTPRLFALAHGANGGQRLFVQQEEKYLSLFLLTDDVARLLRTKHLAPSAGHGPSVLREIRLALRFLRSDLGVSGEISVSMSAEDDDLRDELLGWLSKREDISLAPPVVRPPFADPTISKRLGDARIAPALELIRRVEQ